MPPIQHLTTANSHLTFAKDHESTGKPSVLYVSNSSLPACKTFNPQYEALATRYSSEYGNLITFAQMEFSAETSMLFKFAPNQLPILTLMCREREGSDGEGEVMWAKTVMGADLKELEKGIREMLGRAGVVKK